MKKSLFLSVALMMPALLSAQSAIDAYRLSQPDLKGTARFMSMGGAFTALGGDLSTLSQNPGGIGVYRNSDIGFTLDLDLQSAKSTDPSDNWSESIDQTKFLLNNIGAVVAIRTGSDAVPNFDIGFTYNKSTSFNRRYVGSLNLRNSLSNLIAADASYYGYSQDELYGKNPYMNSNAGWLDILGYNAYLISPTGNNSNKYYGQWGQATTGVGYFDVLESGGVDDYNISFGGNIYNTVYWGMTFDITHMNYNLSPIWGEELNDARVDGKITDASWYLSNYYNCSGTGFNYKLGFIIKPIQELRLGFAFHTPTWYSMTETYYGGIDYAYGARNSAGNIEGSSYAETNNGNDAYDNFNFRTPWKINAGIAAVLFNRLIVSADYEWANYSGMRFSSYSGYGYDPWDDGWYGPYYGPGTRAPGSNDPYFYSNSEIKSYYGNTNTFRVGAEFRVLPRLALRVGYSHTNTPVKSTLKDGREYIYTAGTIPNYRVDNATNYLTAGLGFTFQHFYIDAAYVYKHIDSDFHAYSPDYTDNNLIPSPTAKLSLNNSQVVLSAGFKF